VATKKIPPEGGSIVAPTPTPESETPTLESETPTPTETPESETPFLEDLTDLKHEKIDVINYEVSNLNQAMDMAALEAEILTKKH